MSAAVVANSKPRWSVDAFARRVMMGTASLSLIVEGVRTDVAFYDRVLEEAAPASGISYTIFRVQEITGVGGKDSCIDLFSSLKSRGKLSQRASSGVKSILFALDRDYDHLVGGVKRSAHVVYTQYADVEAEIFAHTDMLEVLRVGLSLDRKDAELLRFNMGNVLDDLAERWRDWIRLCVVAEGTRARCEVKSSRASIINIGRYGSLMASEVERLDAAIDGTALLPGKRIHLESKVSSTFARKRGAELVKGKMLPAFFAFRVADIADSYSLVLDVADFEKRVTHLGLAFLVAAPLVSRYQTVLARLGY